MDNLTPELFPDLIPASSQESNTKEIQYYLAYDGQGNVIHIKDAVKGNKYLCPACQSEFILKKSGNTGKGSRRPHFAHNNLDGHFTHEGHLETYLHNTLKTLTYQIIKDKIIKSLPLEIQWKCQHCRQQHKAEIIQLLSDVKLECTISDQANPNITRRPDIALIGKNRSCIAVIEIVVTHDIEESAIQFYKQHNIRIIRIKPYSIADLDNAENLLKNPATFDACIQPPPVQQVVYPVTRLIPVIPRYRPSNGVPRDFIDNPNKYGQRRDGSFFRKGNGKKGGRRK